MESTRIMPDDPRYEAVVRKQFNKRFRAVPDYVRLAGSTEDVVGAVSGGAGSRRAAGIASRDSSRTAVRHLDVSAIRHPRPPVDGAVAGGAGATVGEIPRSDGGDGDRWASIPDWHGRTRSAALAS
jgi:hypothetical protein